MDAKLSDVAFRFLEESLEAKTIAEDAIKTAAVHPWLLRNPDYRQYLAGSMVLKADAVELAVKCVSTHFAIESRRQAGRMVR